MPGIFGARSRVPHKHPDAIVEIMRENLSHQPWYTGLVESFGIQVLGALSTNPNFSRENHLACRPEATLLIEGTAITLDGTPIPDNAPDLAECLLNNYLRWGDDFVHHMGGHFNLVVLDHRDGRLQLVNDRLGFAHMYWYADDDIFIFAPELKAFLAWQGLDRTLNEASLASLLARECPFGTETLFSSIQMLAPASRLVFSEEGVQVHRYWRPEPRPEGNRSTDSWLDEAETLYRRSFEKRLPENWDDRVILPLSGGLDSRLLLWQARGQGNNLDLFTHGQKDCTDAIIAGKVASELGLGHRHHLIEMNPDWAGENGRRAVWLNDGQLNLRNATLVGISEELKPGPLPFLNGIIGAHMSLGTGGFVSPKEIVHIGEEDVLRQKVLDYSGVSSGSIFLEEMMAPDTAARMKQLAADQAWRSFDDFRHIELFGDQKMLHTNCNPGRRMQGTVDVHRYFFHDLLPFVDEDLHDMWLRIPLKLRLNNVLYKELYRRRIKNLAAVPWSYTNLNLYATDEENAAALDRRMKSLKRQKWLRKYSLGLINIRNRDAYNHRETWLRKNREFRNLMIGTLSDIQCSGCELFDQGKINRMFQRFDQGRDYLFRPLMQVATVVIWFDLFMKKDQPCAGLKSLTEKQV